VTYLIDGEIIHTIEDNIPRKHAKSLPLFYEKLCSETELTLNNIDGIAVSIGPGSFTGLRIGLSYSKGLAFGCGLPIIPVPTLTAIMKSGEIFNGAAQAILYSHRDIVYAQRFKINNNSLNPDNEIAAYQWKEIVPSFKELDFIVQIGCNDLIGEKENIQSGYTSSSIIAQLANENFDEWVIDKPYSLVPNYISPFNIGVKKF
ncbi:MAG: tRNA (adenosine(37)-N6)-threonylcarbamoyltransferase complex dimerization subunit type 1 TsaB, partial [Candidatus Marinimicrobia bacterium]|nr:tRNA (adenosine(37)-N6)-threonylcarbamoyltransferase complex dimerization subunit type 1 TsaB [Candidatus Neomarinimicrobiota bacterium]